MPWSSGAFENDSNSGVVTKDTCFSAAGTGGAGGGGDGGSASGSSGTASGPGANGKANTGGGGGGGGGDDNSTPLPTGGNGGSGIVIISYLLPANTPSTATPQTLYKANGIFKKNMAMKGVS